MLVFHAFAQKLLLPPFNCLILIAIFSIFLYRKRKLCLSLITLSLILLYLQYTPWFASLLTKMIYPKISALNNKQNFSAQAIVVLGAGADLDLDDLGDLISYPTQSTLRNLNYAQIVITENPMLPVILSGGYTGSGFSEAQAMNDYLLESGVLNPVRLEDKSLDTNQNAVYTTAKLKKMHINKIILVTQASHMWRSAALFKKNGINSIEYPAWDEYIPLNQSWGYKFLPAVSAKNQTGRILHELIGYVVYVIF